MFFSCNTNQEEAMGKLSQAISKYRSGHRSTAKFTCEELTIGRILAINSALEGDSPDEEDFSDLGRDKILSMVEAVEKSKLK